MSEFTIEDGVPIPVSSKRHGTFSKTLRSLEVGQSFLIPGETPTGAQPTASRIGRQLKRKFISAPVEGGRRFWRVE